jgi:hypothetical protein
MKNYPPFVELGDHHQSQVVVLRLEAGHRSKHGSPLWTRPALAHRYWIDFK